MPLKISVTPSFNRVVKKIHAKDKTVVDAAGCDIAFTSVEQKGTTFTVTIPLSGMLRKDGTRPLSFDGEKK